MFGMDWYFPLVLLGVIFLILQIVLAFLLPFFVLKIRNTLINISSDVDTMAKNIQAIARFVDAIKVRSKKPA